MNLMDLMHDQVRQYIHDEHLKGRPMKEVIREVIAVRNDFVLLSHDPQVAEQQTLNALGIVRYLL